jgi:hypothetical protein
VRASPRALSNCKTPAYFGCSRRAWWAGPPSLRATSR